MPRVGASANFTMSRRKGIALSLVLALSFFLLMPTGVGAQEGFVSDFQATDTLISWCSDNISAINIIMCGFGIMISALLELIVWGLGLLILLVIEVLIAFASYNDFANAQVVQTGWRIVRDITNMFFIVILLVSAFATIIGYDTASFHYKKVLPKLLLMAVLVNFSRTLIQLLVDFSQVIMLTFVNAFQQAAGGNFVNGLGMTNVMRLPPEAGSGASSAAAPPQVGMVNIILALMLAVVLLSIMLATMIILTLYLIIRIVGIWVALIFSPAAFLATALPDRIARYVGAIGQEYWGKLMGLLAGGPVIAFFLWLTLSTIQQSSGAGGLAPALNIQSNNEALQYLFASGAGSSNQIASFVVGITMMLMAVGIAVQASQQASKTFGSLAGRIAGAGQQLGGKLAIAGAAAPAYLGYQAGRGAGRAAAGAYGAVDRRLDVTGGVSRRLLTATGGLPIGDRARQTLLRGATLRRREAAGETGEASTGQMLSHLSPEEQQNFVSVYGKKFLPTMRDRVERQKLLDSVTSDKAMQQAQKSRSSKIQQGLEASGVEKEEAKRRAELRAQEDVAKANGALLKESLESAKESGDFDAIEKYQKQYAQNPLMHSTDDEIAKQVEKMRTDPDKLAGMTKEAKQSFAVALNALPTGAIKEQDGVVQGFDQAALERFYEQNAGNKELVDTVRQAVDFVGKSDGKGVSKQELLSMHKRRASDGTYKIYGKTDAGTGQQFEAKQTEQYKRTRGAVEASFSGGGGVDASGELTSGAETSVTQALSSGVSLSDIADLAKGGQKAALAQHLGSVSADASSKAASAQSKQALDEALQDAIQQWQQLDQVDSDMQVKILSGIQSGGGAQTIAAQWDLADGRQRQAMQKVVQQAVRRASEVAKKRASGASVSSEEQQVEALVAQLRQEMPRTKTGSTKAAPAAIRKSLHESES